MGAAIHLFNSGQVVKRVQTIDRMMQITNCFSSEKTDKNLSISDLAEKCNLPLSTMHRLLKGMEKHKLIQQDSETKLYTLGNAWLEFGLQMYDRLDFIALIRTELESLMHEVKETVYFSKPLGLESLILERIDCPENKIRVYDQLGIRIPMHVGAANKVMLANMPEQEALVIVNTLLASEERAMYLKMLKQIKVQGYGESHEEKTPRTSALAAPVFNYQAELVGAVSIGFVNFNLADDRITDLVEQVINAGIRISTNLGYIPSKHK